MGIYALQIIDVSSFERKDRFAKSYNGDVQLAIRRFHSQTTFGLW